MFYWLLMWLAKKDLAPLRSCSLLSLWKKCWTLNYHISQCHTARKMILWRARHTKGAPTARGWEALKRHTADQWKLFLTQKLYRAAFIRSQGVTWSAMQWALLSLRKGSTKETRKAMWKCEPVFPSIGHYLLETVLRQAFICILVFDRSPVLCRAR